MDIIAEFNDDKGFNVKLTKDKIFITAIGNEETFALRGVNGVGLYDDIEKYNKELEDNKIKNNKISWKILIGFGVFMVALGILLQVQNNDLPGYPYIFEGIIIAIIGYLKSQAKTEPPKLDSYFKLILSGGDRKFKFDKNDETSASIADFINKIEDTLTAYK
jgi:hypothetical protein